MGHNTVIMRIGAVVLIVKLGRPPIQRNTVAIVWPGVGVFGGANG